LRLVYTSSKTKPSSQMILRMQAYKIIWNKYVTKYNQLFMLIILQRNKINEKINISYEYLKYSGILCNKN